MNAKPNIKKISLWIGLSLLICFLGYLFSTWMYFQYPMVGTDYIRMLPRLVDTHRWSLLNGLAIQWWSPSFGGGLPVFADPQSMQYSLPQSLVYFMSAFQAVIASFIIPWLVGIIFLTIYFKKWFGGSWLLCSTWSIISLGVFSFHLDHAIVGHLTFHPFLLFPLFCFLFVSEPSINTKTLIKRSAFGALLAAYLIYSGAFHIAILWGFLIPGILLITWIGSSRAIDAKKTFISLGGAALLGICLASPKLIAILEYMKHFPRHTGPYFLPDGVSSIKSLISQIVALPFFGFDSVFFGANYKDFMSHMQHIYNESYTIWEYNVATSLSVYLVIAFAPIIYLRKISWSKDIAIKWFLSIAYLSLIISFISGNGPIYSSLRHTPILSSIHVNQRFTVVLICLMVTASYPILRALLYILNSKNLWLGRAFLATLILLPLLNIRAYQQLIPPSRGTYARIAKIDGVEETLKQIKNNPNYLLPIKMIAKSDPGAIITGGSSSRPSQPLFGYNLSNFHHQLKPYAPVEEEVKPGHYNMHDPREFLKGTPFSLWSKSQRKKFEKFINFKPIDFERSLTNTLCRIFATISAIAIFLMIFPPPIKKIRQLLST